MFEASQDECTHDHTRRLLQHFISSIINDAKLYERRKKHDVDNEKE